MASVKDRRSASKKSAEKLPDKIETSIGTLRLGQIPKRLRRTPYVELLEQFERLPKGAEYEFEPKKGAKASSVVLGLRRTIERDKERFSNIKVQQVGDEVWLTK